MPVVVGIVLPLAAVAVSMLTAAGCRDSFAENLPLTILPKAKATALN